MILLGYATTTDAAVDGYIFVPGAIDCNQEGVKLFHRHQREIGRVLCMQYRDDGRLLVTVETDDPVALKTDFMSPAAQVLALDGKRVTKARLTEISLTGTPANPHCRILERRQNDPLRALWLNRLKWHDQVGQWCGLLQKFVELLPAVDAAMTAAAQQSQPLDAPPLREMTPQDRTRLAAIHERQARRYHAANLPAPKPPRGSFSELAARLNQMEA